VCASKHQEDTEWRIKRYQARLQACSSPMRMLLSDQVAGVQVRFSHLSVLPPRVASHLPKGRRRVIEDHLCHHVPMHFPLCLQQQDGASSIRRRRKVRPFLTVAAPSTTGCKRGLLWAAERARARGRARGERARRFRVEAAAVLIRGGRSMLRAENGTSGALTQARSVVRQAV
jgi:hypothetical protein